MFDLFFNVIMYLIILLLLIMFFKNKVNIFSFLILLFNLDIYFLFIYLNINIVYGILTGIISIILYLFVVSFDKEDEESILIKNGNINFHEVIKHYSYHKLFNYLKLRKIKLDEIEYCIKSNNRLIVIKNKNIKSFPVSIIIDGNIREENLRLINKNKIWLNEELLKKHLLVKNIEYAYYWKNKIYFINN